MNREAQESGLLRRIGRRLGHLSNGEARAEGEPRPEGNGNPASNELPSPAHFRVLMREAFRAALRAEAFGRSSLDSSVRKMVREACDEARACGTPVEQLIILLKDEMPALPEAHHCTHSVARDVLGRTVTLCIDEYYRPRMSRAELD